MFPSYILSSFLLSVSLWPFVYSHSLPGFQMRKDHGNTMIIVEPHRETEQQFVKTKQENPIAVNLTEYMYNVSDQFLSVGIGTGNIQHNWNAIDFTATRIINMAKALTPAMLRVGGKAEDSLLFQETTKPRELVEHDSDFIMNQHQWDAVNVFVEAAGWDFIFGLNVLLRVNGSWNSANAEELLTYTTSKGFKVNWELGNGKGWKFGSTLSYSNERIKVICLVCSFAPYIYS